MKANVGNGVLEKKMISNIDSMDVSSLLLLRGISQIVMTTDVDRSLTWGKRNICLDAVWGALEISSHLSVFLAVPKKWAK